MLTFICLPVTWVYQKGFQDYSLSSNKGSRIVSTGGLLLSSLRSRTALFCSIGSLPLPSQHKIVYNTLLFLVQRRTTTIPKRICRGLAGGKSLYTQEMGLPLHMTIGTQWCLYNFQVFYCTHIPSKMLLHMYIDGRYLTFHKCKVDSCCEHAVSSKFV